MLRKVPTVLGVALLGITAALNAAPTKFQVGATRLNMNSLSPGWVVFTAADGVTYVVDQNGIPVHTWVSPDPTSQGLRGSEPIEDQSGHVLSLLNAPVIPGCGEGDDCGKLVEMDWDGNVVWEYVDTERELHHDVERLENGNTLMLCAKTLLRPEIAATPVTDDCLIEVDPEGEIVWEWQTADHYDALDLTDEERQMISDLAVELGGDWSHGNAIDSISSNTPHDDPRFRPGNIIVSYRHINLTVIIDRDTDEIVWQNREGIGQHHTHMIENGLVGAGLIMAFDNGYGGQYPAIARTNSRVIEIDPITEEVVRSYEARATGIAHWTFYSLFSGYAQRMPNGNTFVTEAMFGRAFEVTPSGRMAWEFVSPVFSDTGGFLSNQVSRYYKVPIDWVGPLDAVFWPE